MNKQTENTLDNGLGLDLLCVLVYYRLLLHVLDGGSPRGSRLLLLPPYSLFLFPTCLLKWTRISSDEQSPFPSCNPKENPQEIRKKCYG